MKHIKDVLESYTNTSGANSDAYNSKFWVTGTTKFKTLDLVASVFNSLYENKPHMLSPENNLLLEVFGRQVQLVTD